MSETSGLVRVSDKSAGREQITVQEGRSYCVCEGMEDAAALQSLANGLNVEVSALFYEPGATTPRVFESFCRHASFRGARRVGLVFDAEESRATTMAGWADVFERVFAERNPVHTQIYGGHGDFAPTEYCVLVNPTDQDAGALEGLFVPQISGKPGWECIEGFIECIRPLAPASNPYSDVRLNKVRVRAYTAIHNPRNTGIKVALQDGVLTVQTPEFQAMNEFVSMLAS